MSMTVLRTAADRARRYAASWAAFGLTFGLGLSACVGDSATCSTGSLGCECFAGNACEPGLFCLANACFPLGDASDQGETGDGDNHGDGDGTPSGDGDGTPNGDGDGEPNGDGDGDGDPIACEDPGPKPNGADCHSSLECGSCHCYLLAVVGGQCGECNADDQCPNGGCSQHNPLASTGSTCNSGELGGGCQTNAACQAGLTCSTAFSLSGIVELDTCGECTSDGGCPGQICAPVVDLSTFAGANICINPNSRPQHSYCDLDGNGDLACASSICSVVDFGGFLIGACGQCNTDADCGGGTCVGGTFDMVTGLTGSTCN